MATPTLYLHVGPAKTGTSAIQHYFKDKTDGAIFYPRVGQWPDGSHHNLALNFLGNFTRPEVVRRDAGEMLDEIGAEARQRSKDILISSEIFAGARNVRSFIEACKTRWRIDSLKIKILIVCREHFERASSLYNQRVKDAATLERETPDEFLAQRADKLLYAPIIKKLQQTGLDVTVLNYHPAESFLSRFTAEIGDVANQDLPVEQHNVSLSVPSLIVLLALNRIAADATEREALRARLGQLPDMFSRSKFIFGENASLTAKKLFAPDRKLLQNRFAIALNPPRIRETRSSLYLSDDQWREIAKLASELGNKSSLFLAEVAKFRSPEDASAK